MKKFILLVLAAATVFNTSCSEKYLENEKLGSTGETTENYYQGDDAAEAALTMCYYYLRFAGRKVLNGLWWDMYNLQFLSDDLTHVSNSINEGSLGFYKINSQSGGGSVWSTMYRTINACNRVTDHFAEGLTANQKRCYAEAQTLKAYCYLLLAETFGNVPLVKTVPTTEAEYKPFNNTKSEVYEFILEILDDAINTGALPVKVNADTQTAHVTKEFAYSLKGKALMDLGKYSDAKTALQNVVDSDKYRLMTKEELKAKFWENEVNGCRFTCESMLELYVDYDKSTDVQAYWYQEWKVPVYNINYGKIGYEAGSYISKSGGTSWLTYVPSDDFVLSILDNEGFSDRVKATFYTYEQLQELGMRQIDSNRTENTATFLARTNEKTPTCDTLISYSYEFPDYQPGLGLYLKKNTCYYGKNYRGGTSNGNTHENRPLFRVTEAYLLYCEACVQSGDASNAKAIKIMNDIKTRAGYKKNTDLYSAPLSLDDVKKEKRFETFNEFCRRNDLIRWGEAESKLQNVGAKKCLFFGYKEGKTADDVKDDFSNFYDVYETRIYDINGFNATTGATAGSFIKGTHELLPIPLREIQNNQNLTQNPGYNN